MICLRGPGTNLSLPQVLIGAAKGEGWGGGGGGGGKVRAPVTGAFPLL